MLKSRDLQLNIQSEFIRYIFDGHRFGKIVYMGLLTRQHVVIVSFNFEAYGSTGRAEFFNLFFSHK